MGELDNWVPAEPCVEFIENLKFKGHDNASITVFPILIIRMITVKLI